MIEMKHVIHNTKACRYLCPLILMYCSMMSMTMTNWVKMRTRSPLSFICGSKSSSKLNFPLSHNKWFPRLKCSIHCNNYMIHL